MGDKSDEESEWEYPVSEPRGIDLIFDVCKAFLFFYSNNKNWLISLVE